MQVNKIRDRKKEKYDHLKKYRATCNFRISSKTVCPSSFSFLLIGTVHRIRLRIILSYNTLVSTNCWQRY